MCVFRNAQKGNRCVCGRGISQWCLQHFVASVISQHRVIDYSDHATDCFTQISLWPYRWEITSAAERMIGGKWDGPNLLSHYHSPVRKDGREWEGEGQRGRESKTERREGLINKEGRWESAKRPENAEKQEPKSLPNSDVYFIWGGRCAGSTTLQCFSGPF